MSINNVDILAHLNFKDDGELRNQSLKKTLMMLVYECYVIDICFLI